MKKDEVKKYEPIIFMNSPITSETNDAIGISSSVAAIEKAIDDDAKMVGIIAEYGAGKSSLTETLASKKRFKKPIYINMWDSLQDMQADEDKISNLTKSFIYQLAIGKSNQTANHVNKILSRNYSIISFSIGLKRFWFFAVLAVLFIAAYMILDNLLITDIVSIFGAEAENAGLRILAINPIFLVIGIVLLILGIRNTNIAFSKWKAEEKRDTEINEVFAAYAYVYNKLLKRKYPRIVVIEDLDRIEKQECIIGFLKELYRFNNLNNIKGRKKPPVFLVSISPESRIRKEKEVERTVDKTKNQRTEKEDSNEYIYSKIFDYIISLKPIHYDDYRTVLKEIIFADKLKKDRLNELLCDEEKIVGDDLSEAFTWLYRGENLTLRELKDRLNKSIALLIDLKNKKYGNDPFIRFRTCVGVVYLEQRYPKDFYTITHKEDAFSRLIQKSYIWRNDVDTNNVEYMTKEIEEIFPENEMAVDLATLIYDGVIDTDFRMYFYSFPKGSYIKDIDEKDICNYLELPRDYLYDLKTLDEKISRIEEKGKIGNIERVVSNLSNSTNTKIYPKVVFENDTLFGMAYKADKEKCVKSLYDVTIIQKAHLEEMIRLFSRIQTYKSYDEEFAKQYHKLIIINYTELPFEVNKEDFLNVRKAIVRAFGEKVIIFKELFIDEPHDLYVIPLITQEEIEEINNISVAIQLINKNSIQNDNFDYIENTLTSECLDVCILDRAIEIQSEIISTIPFNKLCNYVYDFLLKNLLIDIQMFSLICKEAKNGAFDKQKICDYLNELSVSRIEDEYLKEIDELWLDDNLNEGLVKKLISKRMLQTALLFCAKNNFLSWIDFHASEILSKILKACQDINHSYPDMLPKIRKEIIRQDEKKAADDYFNLFMNDFCIVTSDELEEFSNFILSMRIIDGSQITADNIDYIVNHINVDVREGEVCYTIFDLIFNEEYSPYICEDSEMISNVINRLDYNKIVFDSMNEEHKEKVVDMLLSHLNLGDGLGAKEFMLKVRCLIKSLEEVVENKLGEEDYIDLINNIGKLSERSREFILSNDPEYPLCDQIANQLLQTKNYKHYIVGNILFHKKFSYPMESVPDEELISLYYSTSPVFKYLIAEDTFIRMMWDKKVYKSFEKVTWEMLAPFNRFKQTKDFLKFVFEVMDDATVISYLTDLNEIESSDDSIGIADLIVEKRYIKYLEEDTVFGHVQFRLWEDDKKSSGKKGQVTRKRNEYLKSQEQD